MEPEDLSEGQRDSLNKFRERVSDVLKPEHDDFYLSRWLIARSWDIPKAEEMLRTSLDWRRLHDMDNILTTWTPPEVLKLYTPGGFCGCDKEGSPIWIECLGNLDIKGLFASARVKDLFRNRLHVLEKCEVLVKQEGQKRGKNPGGTFIIYDFENYGLKQMWKPGIDLVAEMFSASELNYPELLKICFVIKAPRLFHLAYSFMKPFLHERTKSKVQVLGRNWKEKLLETIDPDQLPVYWGGTQTDPDGDIYSKSKICRGGIIPESFYNDEHARIDRSKMVEAVVGQGSSLKVELQVEVPNSIISWQFVTDDHDLGFGISLEGSGKKKEGQGVVVGYRRVNSNKIPESGSVLIPIPGTYVVRFDNSYSWINSKKLFYSLELLAEDPATAS